MLLMGKSTISMVIFNSELLVYQRVYNMKYHHHSPIYFPFLNDIFFGMYGPQFQTHPRSKSEFPPHLRQ